VLSWSAANALGAALGAVIDLPIDVMSFGMTAIFICLLAGQRWDRTNTLVAAVTAAVLVVGKLFGAGRHGHLYERGRGRGDRRCV
jgi:predicted branched-subunit amino acid permease